MKRYAEGTSVSVESSRGEISGILAKHGVTDMGWTSNAERDELFFLLDGYRYRLTVVKPTLESEREWARKQGGYLPQIDLPSRVAKEWKRRWRATVLLLKAKLEFADGETSTIAHELMPYLILADGKTMSEALLAGDVPLLMGGKR
jgi:hypothetical protein